MATRFEKYPAEDYHISFEWAGRLPTGKTLTSVAASATRTDTGADATSTVLGSTSPPVAGTAAAVNVKAGTANVEYDIRLLSTFHDGSDLEDTGSCS
jgi:hypothetical protein